MSIDGIPAGTLRSNMGDTKVSGDDWCRAVGSHRYAVEKDGTRWCRDCFKTEEEINGKIKGTEKE